VETNHVGHPEIVSQEVPMRFLCSLTSVHFTYHQALCLKILRSAHTAYLCILYGSENKQRLFPNTALTFNNREGACLQRGTDRVFKYN
jgi:hypothetical protein